MTPSCPRLPTIVKLPTNDRADRRQQVLRRLRFYDIPQGASLQHCFGAQLRFFARAYKHAEPRVSDRKFTQDLEAFPVLLEPRLENYQVWFECGYGLQ
jgi:hypothetical protein